MPTTDITKLIEDAIRDRLLLRISYQALDGTGVESLMEPLAIRFSQARHRVLRCWTHDAEHLEQLLWDRITGPATTGEGSSRDPGARTAR